MRACPTVVPWPLGLFASLSLALAACSCSGSKPGGSASQPMVHSVVLITVDTLRADRLGCYGGAVPTPNIDRLARRSVLFERAYAQATLTYPALTSVLTGLTPTSHGVHGQAGLRDKNALSLPQMLSANGLKTGAFVANLCRLNEFEGTVFHDGWQDFFCGMPDGGKVDDKPAVDDPEHPPEEQHLWDRAVVDAGLQWIAARQHEPFLAWIHLMDPHAEHRPDPAFWDYAARPVPPKYEQYRFYNAFEEQRQPPPAEVLAELDELYAAEIRSVDAQVGRLLDALDARADREHISVIFSADHGEELFETWVRYDHGFSMTEGVLHVPLLVQATGLEPRRFSQPVETLAITPTVLQLLGLRLPPNYSMDAASLLGQEPSRGFAFSCTETKSLTIRSARYRYYTRVGEAFVRPADSAPWRTEAPWFQRPQYLVRYEPEGSTTPVEVLQGSAEFEAAVRELQPQLMQFFKSRRHPEPAGEITDPEFLKTLKALGYTGAEIGTAEQLPRQGSAQD